MAVTVLKAIDDMRRYSAGLKRQGAVLGLVPTMGYLHEGHASLIRLACNHADRVVVSVFVNPTQFAPHEDFSSYPRDLDRDLDIAERAGADVVFTPEAAAVYPPGYATSVVVGAVSGGFEGAFRPSHFEGVATVVTKLFNIVAPDLAVFGRKDYQQCAVVRQLVRDLNIPTDVVVAPTVREPDGLAMSSRNVYLSTDERRAATVLFRALQQGRAAVEQGERDRTAVERVMAGVIASEPLARIDYAAAADGDTLAQPDRFASQQPVVLLLAVRIGSTRLIDNDVVIVP